MKLETHILSTTKPTPHNWADYPPDLKSRWLDRYLMVKIEDGHWSEAAVKARCRQMGTALMGYHHCTLEAGSELIKYRVEHECYTCL